MVYITVALLAWGAIAVMQPLPTRRAGDVLALADEPAWVVRVDTLERGETMGGLLSRSGLSSDEAMRALQSVATFDARRARAGMRVTLGGRDDSTTTEIILHLAIDRLLRLRRTDSGWVGHEEVLPWETDTIVVRGEVSSTLTDAFLADAISLPHGARSSLAWEVADVFEYRVDMSRDLQPGDRFVAVVERQRGPEGVVRVGRLFAAEYESGSSRMRVFRHEREGERARYYDESGRAMEASFLRAPLEFRRISSNFGMRRHPILGVWRRHAGTDYAAASGTPVRAIGDGVVVAAGRMSGYGNMVDIRHHNGFVTRYGHLRGFARGIRRGSRVSIGETIGFVGMTGLATAPHLHFEVLIGGAQRNPRTALRSDPGRPLADSDRPRFDTFRERFLILLAPPNSPAVVDGM
ncbi:MAG: peptidoglycan DD-metalloendopeptidase family protein [Gemmatimonadota bacterium]